MLHHVTLEVLPSDIGRASEFWAMLGFFQVEPPEDLAPAYTWFERGGTQVHLMHAEAQAPPRRGHVAVVVPDFARTVERLEESGFGVEPKRERWGAARAEAIAPGGHRVELMAAAPPA